jgi:hypothetical protein
MDTTQGTHENRQDSLSNVQKRFVSNSPLMQLLIYSIALKEERYEILAEIDPMVDDAFRKQVNDVQESIYSLYKINDRTRVS